MKKPVLYLAPLQGVTDYTFRNVYHAHFPDYDLAVAPYITTKKGMNIRNYRLKDILPENNTGLPLIPQILSKEPEDFVFLSNYLINDLGYDKVNWNLGCPYPTAVGKQRGAGLLPRVDLIRNFLDRVTAALPERVSIKTRLGLYTSEELFELMPVLNQYPLSGIIIHPRTGQQKFTGAPDREAFAACLSISVHPVAYNGDITDTKGFASLARQFPQVGQWMIGRAAIADPFLAGDIKQEQVYPTAEKKGRVYRFMTDLTSAYQYKLYGPAHPAHRMKGIWEYLHTSFTNGEKVFRKLKKVQSIKQYQDTVDQIFQEEQWGK